GDPDAVPVGDFHLPHLVAGALAGEPRGTDERMLEPLAPFAGHRRRVDPPPRPLAPPPRPAQGGPLLQADLTAWAGTPSAASGTTGAVGGAAPRGRCRPGGQRRTVLGWPRPTPSPPCARASATGCRGTPGPRAGRGGGRVVR